MKQKATRFHIVKIDTSDFDANIQKNAELALLHEEGWSIVDVQPVEERGKMYWMAVMSPPVDRGPTIVETAELVVAAPFIGLVAGLTTGIINWMVGA